MCKLSFLFPWFILISIFSGILSSCKKDENPENNVNNPGNNGNVSARYVVQILDDSQNPVSDAYVLLGGMEEWSDENGLCFFSSSNFRGGNTAIVVRKNGFFDYAGSVFIQAGEHNWVIDLSASQLAGTFQSASGSEIVIPGGAFVEFQPNSVVNENGNSYSGLVSVFASYIEPSALFAGDVMPNSFLGEDEDDNEVFLENHGAVIVELKGSGNEQLQIAEGSTAQIMIPVADVDQMSPPASLPLYYFDEVQGYWMQEGQAELSGQFYVGNVSHFTWWMCPYVYEHHSLTGYLMCSEYPLANAELSIYNQWGAYLGSVQSGSNGYFFGMIPEILTFDLVVSDPCGNQAYAQQIGPFNSDTQLPDVPVCSGAAVYSVISADIYDCEGDEVSAGYCRVVSDNLMQMIPADNQGHCENAVLCCDNSESCVISAWNPLSAEVSPDQLFEITELIEAGNLLLCDNQNEYVQFTLDGIDYYFTPGPFSIFGSTYSEANDRIGLNVLGGEFMNETQFQVLIEGSVPGQYQVGGSGFDYSFILSGNDGVDYITLNLSQSGISIGSVIEGNIVDTEFHDAGGNLRTLENCSFRIILQTLL